MAAAIVALRPALETLVIRAANDPENVNAPNGQEEKAIQVGLNYLHNLSREIISHFSGRKAVMQDELGQTRHGASRHGRISNPEATTIIPRSCWWWKQ